MKLLRKIRQDKIYSGKIKDYLLYSIGEILLVVIGILIAVQVNNWNQGRITSKKETQILQDIKNEFQRNEKKISEKQDSRKSTAPKLDKYITEIAAGKADEGSFSDFHQTEFMHGMTNPSNGVIDALISSGEISIITNDSLKYLLAGWKNQLENLYENEQILWNSGLDFIGSYSNEIPDARYQWSDLDKSRNTKLTKDILARTEYRNKLVGFAGCSEIVVAECEQILEDMRKIIRIIEMDIDNR